MYSTIGVEAGFRLSNELTENIHHGYILICRIQMKKNMCQTKAYTTSKVCFTGLPKDDLSDRLLGLSVDAVVCSC